MDSKGHKCVGHGLVDPQRDASRPKEGMSRVYGVEMS